jgi:hypothetical protein
VEQEVVLHLEQDLMEQLQFFQQLQVQEVVEVEDYLILFKLLQIQEVPVEVHQVLLVQ